MQSPIESQKADCLEELFIGNFCTNCGHLISEHKPNCFGLDKEGCWKACLCKKTKTDFILIEGEF